VRVSLELAFEVDKREYEAPQIAITKRATRKVSLGGGFVVSNWSATCQVKEKKVAIVMPVLARRSRAGLTTLTPRDRNRAIPSARLPDEDL
jgi:hypothetical protein